jgi:predicted nucleotidyltransferase component of viral defense system
MPVKRNYGVEIKTEVNFVMRGTIHPVRRASLTDKAREVLRADLDIPIASFEDLYGGKLVAAMDRQHPRDLFDAMQLFAHEGITPGIRRAFVIYLASHNRPIREVLFPAAAASKNKSREVSSSGRGVGSPTLTALAHREWRENGVVKPQQRQ